MRMNWGAWCLATLSDRPKESAIDLIGHAEGLGGQADMATLGQLGKVEDGQVKVRHCYWATMLVGCCGDGVARSGVRGDRIGFTWRIGHKIETTVSLERPLLFL